MYNSLLRAEGRYVRVLFAGQLWGKWMFVQAEIPDDYVVICVLRVVKFRCACDVFSLCIYVSYCTRVKCCT